MQHEAPIWLCVMPRSLRSTLIACPTSISYTVVLVTVPDRSVSISLLYASILAW
jgi:hypothetical protein